LVVTAGLLEGLDAVAVRPLPWAPGLFVVGRR
jgi:hypothetical protein